MNTNKSKVLNILRDQETTSIANQLKIDPDDLGASHTFNDKLLDNLNQQKELLIQLREVCENPFDIKAENKSVIALR
ncbi:hypothetical protein IFU23_24475 [Pantoea agglomerans]|uniref:Uncharacterized protein n=1 Tax=Enterobacter agglomerans TaxID=549 RepID=A0ACC5PY79_ENTAG|nr:hypothetical protein [Pantoea agglomerans]MBD8129388.1 hypothetical protein [Pantoea agglomerans]MBD8156481.1 hypothetical protein [Pantoea agglomerans]MBD8161232.1 hypothetical protein [Pantoea agglomerans]MBD8234898.1 hypothetical protein [Pantoea agglomerans]MBD8245295.1 hypothetical protein [Pantoea agglomerans]